MGGELLVVVLIMAALARSEYCSLWRRWGTRPTPEDLDDSVPPSSKGIKDGEECVSGKMEVRGKPTFVVALECGNMIKRDATMTGMRQL